MNKRAVKTAAIIAGVLGNATLAKADAEDSMVNDESLPDWDTINVGGLNSNLPTYIAAHRSHASHSSHSSHRSSAGSTTRRAPVTPTPSPAPRSSTPSPSRSTSEPLSQPPRPAQSVPNSTLTDAKKASNLESSLSDVDKRRNLVMRVQLTLQILEFYEGNIDGIMGDGTRASINRFRSTIGLPQHDKLDVKTLDSLGILAY